MKPTNLFLSVALLATTLFACKPNVPCDPTDPNSECYVKPDDSVKSSDVRSIQAAIDSVANAADNAKFVLKGDVPIANLTFDSIVVLHNILNSKPHIEFEAALALYKAAQDSVDFDTQRQEILNTFIQQFGGKIATSNNGDFFVKHNDNPNNVLDNNPELAQLRTDTAWATNTIFGVIPKVLVVDKNINCNEISFSEKYTMKLKSVPTETTINGVFFVGGLNIDFLKKITSEKITIDNIQALGEWYRAGGLGYPPQPANDNAMTNPVEASDFGSNLSGITIGGEEELLIYQIYGVMQNKREDAWSVNLTPARNMTEFVCIIDPQVVSAQYKTDDEKLLINFDSGVWELRELYGAQRYAVLRINGNDVATYMTQANRNSLDYVIWQVHNANPNIPVEQITFEWLQQMYSVRCNADLNGVYNAYFPESGSGKTYYDPFISRWPTPAPSKTIR